jgi:hypothetical protein
MKKVLGLVCLLAMMSCGDKGGSGGGSTSDLEANFTRLEACAKKLGGTQTSPRPSATSLQSNCTPEDINKLTTFSKCFADGCEGATSATELPAVLAKCPPPTLSANCK